jgi:hypothetical protein
MRYMLFLYGDEDAFDALTPAQAEKVIGMHMEFSRALEKAGASLAGEPLEHSRSARRVTKRDGRLKVEDGPFTDSKEQIGGFYLIEAKNLDEALDWAARTPTASDGVVEVRPIWEV